MSATALSCPGVAGDLIVFQRKLYKHYAVNVGDDEIVHVAAIKGLDSLDIVDGIAEQFISANPSVAVIKKEKFENFYMRGDKVYVEKRKRNSLTRTEIVERALSKIGEKGYNVISKNCEHFARWCCYGKAESSQADALKYGATAAAVTIGIWIAYKAFGGDVADGVGSFESESSDEDTEV